MGLTKLVDFKVFLPLIFAVIAVGLASSLQEADAGNGFCNIFDTSVRDQNSEICFRSDGNTGDMDWQVGLEDDDDDFGEKVMDEQDLKICLLVDDDCDSSPVRLGEGFSAVTEGVLSGEGSIFTVDYSDSFSGDSDLSIRVIWELIGGAFGSFDSTLKETIKFTSTAEESTNTYRFFQRTDFELSDDDDDDIGEILSSSLARQTGIAGDSRPALTGTITTSPGSDNFMVGDDHDDDDGMSNDVSNRISEGELNGNAGQFGPNDINIGFSWDFTLDTGEMFTIEKTKTIGLLRTGGGAGHEPPTIGKALDGVRQVVDCGISIDGQCRTVTSNYHEEMELLQMLTSPHTISNVIHCDKGVEYCNYIAVGFMGLTDDFNNPLMTVSASKDHQNNWTIDWYDPGDYISDPGDFTPGDIVFVPQVIDNKLLGTSFTIDFKNKDTGQLKMGIQVRDSYNGVRNFYFNEGVEFIDEDAYPAVEALYDAPIEVEPLCFGQNNLNRDSCAFAKVKDWATANAEETLRQMLNDQYQYEQ